MGVDPILFKRHLLLNSFSEVAPLFVAFLSIVAFFIGGELDRRDQEAPFGKNALDPLRKVSFLKVPLLIVGAVLAVYWLILYRAEIYANLELISANWIPILASTAVLAIISIVIVKWHTRKTQSHAIV